MHHNFQRFLAEENHWNSSQAAWKACNFPQFIQMELHSEYQMTTTSCINLNLFPPTICPRLVTFCPGAYWKIMAPVKGYGSNKSNEAGRLGGIEIDFELRKTTNCYGKKNIPFLLACYGFFFLIPHGKAKVFFFWKIRQKTLPGPQVLDRVVLGVLTTSTCGSNRTW